MPNADPAQTGGWNYVDNLLVDQPNRQALARIDFNLSDNTKLFVRYNYQRETQPWVIGLWWRNGQRQVPYPTSISSNERLRLGHDQPHPRVRPDADVRDDRWR